MADRRSALFFLFLLCVFFTLITSPFASADERDKFEYVAGTGLEIHTNPHGAKVFIDGIERGVTPFFSHDLPARTYLVELRRETYTEKKFNAVVLSNSRLIVTMEMEIAFGLVDISVRGEEGSLSSLPFNPRLSARGVDKTLDAITLSPNNTALAKMPLGNQTIHARAFGWEDASINVLVSGQNPATAEIFMKPAEFKISKATQSRRRFNPLNSGSLGITEYRFEVTAPGTGVFKVIDSDDNIVYTRQLEQFDTWLVELAWDGTDSDGKKLPAGSYTILIEASPLLKEQEEARISELKLKTEINYSLNIFPLSLESGIAGLSFAPMPHTMPAKSFQVNASFLFNNNEYAGISFPFKLALRISPFERFELVSVLNFNPYIEHDIGWGALGSLKYNFFDGSASAPIAFSLGASYTWANNTQSAASGEYPLSPGKGVGFYAPFSLELEKISVVFCPAAFWLGPEGLVPELLLSAGVMYHGGRFNSGLSARYEFDFKEDNNSRFLAGAEINIFPSPSNIVYSILGGVLLIDSSLGYYAGLGIGLIF